ncbi:MAG: creatininase family protein [Armatimonadetes bacterium]|nr:creatininase family protein [Armatimonadota bacterium]
MRVTRRELVQGMGAVGLSAAGSSLLGATPEMSHQAGEEVRYEWLRPAEMVDRRKQFPVAYLPIGTLEWHQSHNTLGVDATKAHGLLLECAKRGGGIVFPPLFYGENRTEAHLDVTKADVFEVPEENFGAGFMPFSIQEQHTHYHHLLIHVLHQIASLGFRFIIVCAGHYPLLDHARAAMSVFRQTARRREHQRTTGWVFTGYELVRDIFPEAGDHGGPWETSLMMALYPGSVDLSIMSEDVRSKSSEDYGRKAVDAIVRHVLDRVNDMVAHPEKYLEHYTPM